jgi:hypothetical protein
LSILIIQKTGVSEDLENLQRVGLVEQVSSPHPCSLHLANPERA